jgi:hypothetical protein
MASTPCLYCFAELNGESLFVWGSSCKFGPVYEMVGRFERVMASFGMDPDTTDTTVYQGKGGDISERVMEYRKEGIPVLSLGQAEFVCKTLSCPLSDRPLTEADW